MKVPHIGFLVVLLLLDSFHLLAVGVWTDDATTITQNFVKKVIFLSHGLS